MSIPAISKEPRHRRLLNHKCKSVLPRERAKGESSSEISLHLKNRTRIPMEQESRYLPRMEVQTQVIKRRPSEKKRNSANHPSYLRLIGKWMPAKGVRPLRTESTTS